MYSIMRRFQFCRMPVSQLIRHTAAKTLMVEVPTASCQRGTRASYSILTKNLVSKSTAEILSHRRVHVLPSYKYKEVARYSSGSNEKMTLSDLQYEQIADKTLDHLSEFFEILGDSDICPAEFDVMYSSGVLTIAFGEEHGTYVINKQTPNKQIWLSSPTSGPKRYDYINERWIYIHDGNGMHDLLTEEISKILDSHVDVTEAELWDT